MAGWLPFVNAMLTANHGTAVKLYKHGAGVNCFTQRGTSATPLMMAAALGNVQLVEWLCAIGAHLDTADAIGRTPLMAAASRRSICEESPEKYNSGRHGHRAPEVCRLPAQGWSEQAFGRQYGDTAYILGAHSEEIAERIFESMALDMMTGAVAAPDESEPEPEAAGPRTFANSNFKKAYDAQTNPIEMATVVFAKMNDFLLAYCRVHGLTSKQDMFCVKAFVKNLQAQTGEHAKVEVLGDAALDIVLAFRGRRWSREGIVLAHQLSDT